MRFYPLVFVYLGTCQVTLPVSLRLRVWVLPQVLVQTNQLKLSVDVMSVASCDLLVLHSVAVVSLDVTVYLVLPNPFEIFLQWGSENFRDVTALRHYGERGPCELE